MRKGWEIRKLEEICELSAGGDVPKDNFSETQTEKYQIPIYANGEKNNGLYGYTNTAKVLKPSITVSARGTIGFAVKRIKPFFPIVRLIVVTPNDLKELSLDYLDYALRKIDFKHSGSSIPQLTVPMIRDYEIPLPEIAEQKLIVSILDEAFAVIAKAKANAEKNLKNAKELFESYLQGVFENRGEGWEEFTVKECIESNIIYKPLDGNHGEIHPTKADFVDSGIPFIMSRDMKNGGIDEIGCNFITEKQAKSLRTGFAKNGDVLLSHKGTIGTVSVLSTTRDFIVLTPQITFYRIKNKEKLIKEFLYYYFLNPSFQKDMNSVAQGGSTRAYIGITKQLELKIIIAPFKQQINIVNKLDAIRFETKKLEAVYQKKITDLEELKKSILQKAFAGELNVKEAVMV
ncbi:restriction endonuclease subunit S [Pedobacter xixiisoli]|uniref:Type I restriction enzyme, S subunit n=1 Tax=Pedobacter xixiisoli TaxID=1476464 RepID=A0A285ZXH9_9SPHI|nr:restriction endonuclease subunit S [Pedobacter xixiisoli]SOD14330.1 type I restriction enzyme, S subunit [Pedobacter xixiisoli]